jgi:putative dimethyl sulfoxide reductase chaperone
MVNEGILTSEEAYRLAESRSKIYGFLSSAYLQRPDLGFVRKLRSEAVESFVSSLSPDAGLPQEMHQGLEEVRDFIASSKGQSSEEVCQGLSVERTRLLRGIKPGDSPPPPYESVYRDRAQTLMGNATLDVQREYNKTGLSLATGQKEPPDHIGIELEFMRFLSEREAECWGRGERAEALGYLSEEGRFLEEHLTQWVGEFCDRVIEIAVSGFYRGIARMTKGFLADDFEKVCAQIRMDQTT